MEFNCEFNRYIFRTPLSQKSSSTPININGNVSYDAKAFWNIENLEDAILLCRF